MEVVGTIDCFGKARLKDERLSFPVTFYGASFLVSMMKKTIKHYEEKSSLDFSDIDHDGFIDIGVENISSFFNELILHCDFVEIFDYMSDKARDKFIKAFNDYHDESRFQEAIVHFYNLFKNDSRFGDFFEFYTYSLSKLDIDSLRKLRDDFDGWVNYREKELSRKTKIKGS